MVLRYSLAHVPPLRCPPSASGSGVGGLTAVRTGAPASPKWASRLIRLAMGGCAAHRGDVCLQAARLSASAFQAGVVERTAGGTEATRTRTKGESDCRLVRAGWRRRRSHSGRRIQDGRRDWCRRTTDGSRMSAGRLGSDPDAFNIGGAMGWSGSVGCRQRIFKGSRSADGWRTGRWLAGERADTGSRR